MFVKFLLFSIACFFSSMQAFASQDVCASQACIGVVDVGSTGSRLHVYTYKNDPLQDVKKVWTKQIEPGFGSLALKHADVEVYLKKLFSGAPAHIPVYFYATAGMRLLPHEKQESYYELVKDWFAASAWELQDARTITGHEEGVFSWLSVYYSLHKYDDKTIQDLGVLDMGGASVQVTTPVVYADAMHPDDYAYVKLNNRTVTLFTHSFLGLGRELVTQQFLDDSVCYSEGYVLPNTSSGQGNIATCSDHVTKLINGVYSVNKIIQPIVQEEPSKTWYVLGGLSYLAKSSYIQSDNAVTGKNLIEKADINVCHRPWPEVQHAYPNEYELSRACFTASYYHALLIQGYGLASEELIHLVPKETSDWTLGVVLHQP